MTIPYSLRAIAPEAPLLAHLLSNERHEHTPARGVRWFPEADIFGRVDNRTEATADRLRVMEHGIKDPIVFHGDCILIGREDYLAARDEGVAYPRAEYIGSDPWGYFISSNRDRLAVSPKTKREVVRRLLNHLEHGKSPSHAAAPQALRKLASFLGISTRRLLKPLPRKAGHSSTAGHGSGRSACVGQLELPLSYPSSRANHPENSIGQYSQTEHQLILF